MPCFKIQLMHFVIVICCNYEDLAVLVYYSGAGNYFRPLATLYFNTCLAGQISVKKQSKAKILPFAGSMLPPPDLAGLVYNFQNKLIKHSAMLKNVPVVNESLKFIATFL
jgi:hypothetical protein